MKNHRWSVAKRMMTHHYKVNHLDSHHHIRYNQNKRHMRHRVKLFIYIGIFLILGISALILIPKYFGNNLYPLTYRTEIKNSANEFKLNPNFIVAVIYTESHFNPRAVSPVGARGMMQIMPATGAGIARNLGDNTYAGPDSLFDPARNIRYGSYYLKSLMNRYGQNESYTLMHYNGGGGAVLSYTTRGVLPRETQGFVRKVQSTKSVYDQVYGSWWEEKPKETFPQFNTPATSFQSSYTNVKDFWRVLLFK